MKKAIILVIISIIFLFAGSKIFEYISITKATSLMNAMGIKKNDQLRIYCDEKFDSLTLMSVVVDFYDRKILLNGELHYMRKNSKANSFYYTSDVINTIFFNEYIDRKAFPVVPALLAFTYSKKTGEYFITSINAITNEKRWEHKLNCKY